MSRVTIVLLWLWLLLSPSSLLGPAVAPPKSPSFMLDDPGGEEAERAASCEGFLSLCAARATLVAPGERSYTDADTADVVVGKGGERPDIVMTIFLLPPFSL